MLEWWMNLWCEWRQIYSTHTQTGSFTVAAAVLTTFTAGPRGVSFASRLTDVMLGFLFFCFPRRLCSTINDAIIHQMVTSTGKVCVYSHYLSLYTHTVCQYRSKGKVTLNLLPQGCWCGVSDLCSAPRGILLWANQATQSVHLCFSSYVFNWGTLCSSFRFLWFLCTLLSPHMQIIQP